MHADEMVPDNETLAIQIENCIQNVDHLSDWELKFVSDLKSLINSGRKLSGKQWQMLDKILCGINENKKPLGTEHCDIFKLANDNKQHLFPAELEFIAKFVDKDPGSIKLSAPQRAWLMKIKGRINKKLDGAR